MTVDAPSAGSPRSGPTDRLVPLECLTLESEDATRRLAEDVAAILRPGDVLALQGDLGAGKTTFARHLLRAVADDAELEVQSPTFTLAQSYPHPRLPIDHFDFYRLEHPGEADELGLEETLADGAALIEWPQRARDRIPGNALWITLAPEGQSRRTAALASDDPGHWRERLDRSLRIRRFLAANRRGTAARRHLTGDASSRVYERIWQEGASTVLMNAPESPDGPALRDGLSYSRLAHLAESVRPFVAIAGALADRGFSAPRIHAADLDDGLVLLEDLGNQPVASEQGPIEERYEAAIDVLAAMHEMDWPATAPLTGSEGHRLPHYDETALLIEAELYPSWYVPHATGHPADAAATGEFTDRWRALVAALADSETGWVLRDFHSPNLIWLPDRRGEQRIGIIDFQDAVIGPVAYDVAALCQDARTTVSAEMESRLVRRYCTARARGDRGFDEVAFRRDYAILAAQRATKILGIFARLNARDGKPGYLRHIPRMTRYLSRSLTHPALSGVKHWYEDNAPDTPDTA